MSSRDEAGANKADLSGLKRELLEVTTLHEISKVLNSSLDLKVTLKPILEILSQKMGMERGTLTLLDRRTKELIIEVAHGLDADAMKRGRYKIGEGITGKVVETGEPIAVPNVEDEPLFLNRTRARGDIKKSNISFICVPIKIENETVGALSVDRLFSEKVSFEEDLRLLMIISSMVAQAVKISQMVEREKERLSDENRMLRNELKERYRFENIIGESKKMIDVFQAISLVAPTKATVLLRGESGTGKELIARAIHYNSPRANKPFIRVACAALPETLLESELFGYEKGAFTGAVTSKQGRFELANGGSIFLDEIGDINPATQLKLLRILQEKEFERLGGLETLKADVRVIAATNRDLEKALKEGHFREDLYYRLNVIPIFLPPLRDRKEDVPLLVEHFVKKFNKENGKEIEGLTKAAWDFMLSSPWPGNVRELGNFLERAMIVCRSRVIDLRDLPTSFSLAPVAEPNKESGAQTLPEVVEELEQKMIQETLLKTAGNKRKAAKMLGITERILGYKLKGRPDLATPGSE